MSSPSDRMSDLGLQERHLRRKSFKTFLRRSQNRAKEVFVQRYHCQRNGLQAEREMVSGTSGTPRWKRIPLAVLSQPRKHIYLALGGPPYMTSRIFLIF